MAAPRFLLAIVPARKEVIDHLPEAAELGLTIGRGDDNVRVRTHEAIGPDANAVAGGILANEIEKEPLGRVELKDVRLVVAAPGAMVGRANFNEVPTRDARHGPARKQAACPNKRLTIPRPAEKVRPKGARFQDRVA